MQQPEAQKYFSELLARRPAELDEQWPAIRSYLDGDAEPLRASVKKHVGVSISSSYVFPALERRGIGDLDPWETWGFIEHHRTRLEGRGAAESSKRVRQKVRKYESLRDALGILADYYTRPAEQVLSDKIEEAMCSEGAWELSEGELVRGIVNSIRREGTQKRKSHPQTSRLLAPDNWLPDSSARRDLDSFEALEYLQRLSQAAAHSRQTRPTTQELEAFTMTAYMTHKEAAALRGKSENQNKQEALRAARKYRRAAGL